jgi:hypothetical protein
MLFFEIVLICEEMVHGLYKTGDPLLVAMVHHGNVKSRGDDDTVEPDIITIALFGLFLFNLVVRP